MSRIMTWLRGPYKSIRHQWITLPREWLTYGLFRLTGHSWIDFYSRRMNQSTGETIPESYLRVGQEHVDFLARHGLKPSDRLLDIGCGTLRTARYAVPYLNQGGRYTGVEIAESRVAIGRKFMQAAGISDSAYDIVITRSPAIPELKDAKFNVMFAQSVLTHMPESDIRQMLQALPTNLAAGGYFYFTFTERDKNERMGIKDFFHNRDWMRQLCESYGYEFAIMNDWPEQHGLIARIGRK